MEMSGLQDETKEQKDMSRVSSDEIKDGRVYNGYDYRLQVWVVNGIITDVGSGGHLVGQSIYDQPNAERRMGPPLTGQKKAS
jgi:hypothetical protein